MIALIDGDLVCFRCAASAEKEEQHIALYRCDDIMHRILNSTGANQYEVYISGQNNFRKEIDTEYKANRIKTPRPLWLEVCREHLVTAWQARVSDNMEADDMLAISQTSYNNRKETPSIICSLDKDLRQVPGRHYSWEISGTTHGTSWTRPEEFTVVSPMEGLRTFYRQLLIGDTSDNIFGVQGIGPKKAEKRINHLDNEQEMFQVVRELYDDDERLLKNGRLLWLKRSEMEELWSFPISQQLDQVV